MVSCLGGGSHRRSSLRFACSLVLVLTCVTLQAGCGGGSSGGSSAGGTPMPGLAGPDATIPSLGAVALTAEPGVLDVATFAWSQTGGTGAVLVGADTPALGVRAPMGPATLTFRVTATTTGGDVFSDTVQVTVTGEAGVVFNHRSSFAVTSGGEAHAEVIAHHPGTQRVFIVNAADGRIDVYSIANVDAPLFLGTLTATLGGVTPNSVDVSGNLVAVAFENDAKQSPGTIHFYHAGTLAYLGQAPTGALPDMVGFSPDGTWCCSANEGEPNGVYTVDPNGSVTVVELDRTDPNALSILSTVTADFSAFNGDLAALRAAGVRLFGPGASVAQDMEPEYLAFNGDSTELLVTCQENNAFGVLDLATKAFTRIVPLGLKDWSSIAQPRVGTARIYTLPELPVLGTTTAGQDIRLGGFSGLHVRSVDGQGVWHLTVVPDRGPVAEPENVDMDAEAERPFALPGLGAQLVHLAVNPATGAVTVEGQLPLLRTDGVTPITGVSNVLATAPGLAGYDEEPVSLTGAPLALDPYGADLEGVVQLPDTTWWACDEYRPALYRFGANGHLIDRYVPAGIGAAFGTETLPAAYGQRRANRGFEAIAYDPTVDRIYAWIQSPLDNPDVANDANSKAGTLVRIVEVDPATGAVTGEYVQALDCTKSMDKIGDAVYAGETGTFFVIERDSSTGIDSAKKIAVVRLAGATDLADLDAGTYLALAGPGGLLDTLAPAELPGVDVTPVQKATYVDLAAYGYHATDKPEGLARLPDGRLLVINDNDFGLATSVLDTGTGLFAPAPATDSGTYLGVIDTLPAGFDGGDEDGPGGAPSIRIQSWPVHGMVQPDTIAGFACGEAWFYVTANEGDARAYDGFDEEARLRDNDVVLDPTVFPDAAVLRSSAELGRLRITLVGPSVPGTLADGDVDGDGDLDRIHAYGARSFSIWDENGKLVYDSADLLERITSRLAEQRFNQNGPGSFDERSDDKGPEPEGVAVAMIDGVPHAVIGLERYGGSMLFNLREPTLPRYVGFLDNPFDVSPEGLRFVAPADSPTGNALLLAAHEVSGTVAIYEILP
ncbi:MAG: esterase-like activity of phytase family protein [Planctomycetota bacterium]